MEKSLSGLKLPKIDSKISQSTSQRSSQGVSPRCSSLQDYLKQVRLQQNYVKRRHHDKKQQGIKKMSKQLQKCEQLTKLQVRKFDEKERERTSLCSAEDDIIEEENPLALLYRYDTLYKPSHRYRTALTFHDDFLYLYGGFGHEKYLGLAKFSMKKQDWEPPVVEDKADFAVHGHTMLAYKGFSYIYGGVKMDSPTSDLNQINLKTSEMSQLTPAPYRRRDHACAFLTRFMIVQGGIDGVNQVKNTLFYFDTEIGKWSVPQQYQMPFLSHHSLVAVPQKNRRKQYTLHDVLNENLYIFGGRTDKDEASSKLFKIRVRESNDLTTEQIYSKGAPLPRYSACVQWIDPCYICVYGGKSDKELTNQIMNKGIFNDISLFNIDKKEWITPSINIELPFRFGASSASNKNKLYIYGGSEVNNYSDGVLLQLLIVKEGEEDEIQEIVHRRGKFRS